MLQQERVNPPNPEMTTPTKPRAATPPFLREALDGCEGPDGVDRREAAQTPLDRLGGVEAEVFDVLGKQRVQ